MKIVIIPGVGYQMGDRDYNCLGNNIKKEISCDFEIFKWDNYLVKHKEQVSIFSNQILKSGEMAYVELRSFVTQIILDFEFAIKYGGTIDIPYADYYIGHSAGSLFTMAQDKPSTMMGSPVALVKYLPDTCNIENLFVNSIINNDKSVLNLINRYDILAYPVDEPEVSNVYFSGNKMNPLSYFPLTAHTGYWTSSFVAKEIIKHIKSVVK